MSSGAVSKASEAPSCEVVSTQPQVSVTVTQDSVDEGGATSSTTPTLKLKLKKGKNDRQVKWTNETVDNEHLGRKKSKCCCQFVKKRAFGQSDSEESEDDCDHCFGHRTSDPRS